MIISWLIFNVQLINFVFALAGLTLLALTIVLLFDYVQNGQSLYLQFVAPIVWPLLILTTFAGIGSTLLYSEILGFVPCSLCWLQRVALYPQALMSIAAYRMQDMRHFPVYGIVLSAFGFLVAVYQYIYQALPATVRESGGVFCLADGSADCAKKIMEEFGFVTFPFLSAVLFVFLITLYLHLKKDRK